MRLSDFDYHLPEELIAQHPMEPRDASRLLVLHRDSGLIEHKIFHDIIDYLDPGDVLVINDTKVLPARLFGRKETGAAIEVVLLRQVEHDTWEVLVRPGKKARTGTRLVFSPGQLEGTVLEHTESGGRLLKFDFIGDFFALIDRIGQMPLPPYIREKLADASRYQTVYAREMGSAAAPTAGLHFTDELLARIANKGIIIAKVLLHVGLGTFRPVKEEIIENHRMHAEYYEIDGENAEKINEAKKQGHRVISVGTTSTRTLETAALTDGSIMPGKGYTESFIYPGYRFKVVDSLITNFHLPQSTLLMLISAFAGHERVMRTYQVAVQERYRFFSFGDAMMII
ncbi:tRNA preQ1(34) S-adenosylmethionine ribosyltransferase-isomerase QueA [Candidatus Formimonas warabiya]|uniref:S-adenosylmethionine:tRNA ribosyltransferase-isomerase n=1 Tax=Formimonas warabiya TaxID=1761012 RepID=A0A3G1KNC4_FORW1|nr:tRNA preQ1(34) S-adenosylmethionine ribosyltransferase-isomerase QueA [Candidatus Formimonas warabiya]ATW23958.1 tRNA preQ1(34) S-adenosylmethionine ribosyltransferase-isomerase QueA [Candidatus Formimonas warabiya]